MDVSKLDGDMFRDYMLGRRREVDDAEIGVRLARMQERGSSVVLTWGEDDDLWECSWITSGRRFTAHSRYPGTAARLAEAKALAAFPDSEASQP